MFAAVRRGSRLILLGVTLLGLAQALPGQQPIDKGQRVLSAGHSFHVFMPNILNDIARSAGIKDHTQVAVSSIGGSRVIQHWNLADEKNKGKEALKTGKVDVFTMSPIYLPDEGIENFAKLAVESNKDIRIYVQEFWLPYDVYDPTRKKTEKPDRNAKTGEELRKAHSEYFKTMDEHVQALNKQLGKQVLYVTPVGQAVIGLREKVIAGQAPGIKTQEELFTDAIGHVRAPVMALNAYCHYAVIYRKSPVGLPVPAVLGKSPEAEKLNRLLQELAWEAATQHPLSGVKAN